MPYSKAKIFSEVGKQTELIARFSTVAGESGAADAERDVRGFALKFYTEEGNWDMVGNNTPLFFVRDPYKFPDFIHTQKRHPKTNLRSNCEEERDLLMQRLRRLDQEVEDLRMWGRSPHA